MLKSSPPDGLSERERRYVIQQAQNAYYGRDLETLERLLRRLLAMVPRNESCNETAPVQK